MKKIKLITSSIVLFTSMCALAQNKTISAEPKKHILVSQKDIVRDNIISALQAGGGGSKCDDNTFETCPGGYIICLPEIIVEPIKGKLDIDVFDNIVEGKDDKLIREYLLQSGFYKIIGRAWQKHTSKTITEHLMNGNLLLRKVATTSLANHYFLEYVNPRNVSKRHDYVGHVTLLR